MSVRAGMVTLFYLFKSINGQKMSFVQITFAPFKKKKKRLNLEENLTLSKYKNLRKQNRCNINKPLNQTEF